MFRSLVDISSIRSSQNQNRICCASSDESFNDEFLRRRTKTNISEIFHQTHLEDLLEQIQQSLTPIVDQLRQQLDDKNVLTRKQRWNCMKTCAKFLCENLINEKFDLMKNDENIEFIRLRQLLSRSFSSKQIHIGVQTNDDELENHFHRLTIETNENRQKFYHRSASRAFRKLTSDLHRRTDEIPFQSHLKRYHQHRH